MQTDDLTTRRLTEDEEYLIEKQATLLEIEERMRPARARKKAEEIVLRPGEIAVEKPVRDAVIQYRWDRRKKQRAARASRSRNRGKRR